MYRERGSRLPGAVVWTRTATAAEDVRILPDGCMDLIWSSSGELLVAGPDTHTHMFRSRPGQTLTGLRFAPGMGPSVLGVPADELRDRRVTLEVLWRSSDVRRVADELALSVSPGRVLEAAAARRLSGRQLSTPVREMVRLLRSGGSVAGVAEALGLTERQLRRRSIRTFGYGPKTLARILRLQRAVRLARQGVPFAEVALRAGFADQAHLARDVKALAGVPLTTLMG